MAAPVAPVDLTRRAAWALIACLAIAIPVSAPMALEYSVKATFLYKFVPFIEWPAHAFASPESPVVLCVVGDSPFDDRLHRAVANEQVGGRRFRVLLLATAGRGSGCHVMYLAGSDRQSVDQALHSLRGEPVLTVTDANLDPDAKGIVHFVIADNRVRFEIDDAAAAQNGLRISSKLLNLALSVRPRG